MASELCRDYCPAAHACAVARPLVRNQESIVDTKTSQLRDAVAELDLKQQFIAGDILTADLQLIPEPLTLDRAATLVNTIYTKQAGLEVRSRMDELAEREKKLKESQLITTWADSEITAARGLCFGPELNRVGKINEKIIKARYNAARIGNLITHKTTPHILLEDREQHLDKNWINNQICGSPRARNAAKRVIRAFGITER